jgi:hypothetical protein
MEPRGCNRRQLAANRPTRKARRQGETVATSCHRLPETFHGKEGVDGSSPSEGFAIPPAQPSFLFSVVTPAAVFGVHAASTSVHGALR